MQHTTVFGDKKVACVRRSEAKVLASHIQGYLTTDLNLPANATVVDVGANIGLFGVRILELFPSSTVHAFEPIPQIFEALSANAKNYENRFFCERKGVGSSASRLDFWYFPNAPALSTSFPETWENDPESLLRATESQIKNLPKEFWYAKFLPSFIIRLIANRLRKNAVKVEADVITLSSYIASVGLNKIDFLKIDCEGAEYEVLKGITDTDWPKINKLVIEVYDENNRLKAVLELLKKQGFSSIHVEEDENVKCSKLFNVFADR